MALTRRAVWVALAGVVLAAVLGQLGLVATGVGVTAAVIVLCVLVDLVRAAAISALHLSRGGDTRTRLGEPAEVEILITNAGKRPLRGELRDAWVPSAGAQPFAHRIDVPVGERRRVTTTLRPTRRGPRNTDHVVIRSVGPLGIAARQRRHTRHVPGLRPQQTVPWTVVVTPAFTSRRYLPEKLSRLRQIEGSIAVRRAGAGTEFDSLRPYVQGDDVRTIDWRATARRDALVVKTWRPERDRRCVTVLDTGRTSAARIGDEPRLDVAIDAALLLGAVAARAGDRVDLLAGDVRVRGSVHSSTRGQVLPQLVSAMTPLEPALVETDMSMLISQVLMRSKQRCLVTIFTTLDAAAVVEGLLPALPALTARHSVVVASVIDPRVEELAAERGDAEAVYGAASAEHAAAERRWIAAELTRQGVEVVQAPLATFASVVTDAYLAKKAAGRL